MPPFVLHFPPSMSVRGECPRKQIFIMIVGTRVTWCMWLAATLAMPGPPSLTQHDAAHFEHRASAGSAVFPGQALQRLLLRGGTDADGQDDENASSV